VDWPETLTWIAINILSEPIAHPLDCCFRSLKAELEHDGAPGQTGQP
jgi:hypothetical protein